MFETRISLASPILRKDGIESAKEIAICVDNAKSHDQNFRYCSIKCLNCGYPLNGLGEHNYSSVVSGKVCELCHAMESAVRKQKYLAEAHDLWKKEQDKKKQILEKGDKNYF